MASTALVERNGVKYLTPLNYSHQGIMLEQFFKSPHDLAIFSSRKMRVQVGPR